MLSKLLLIVLHNSYYSVNKFKLCGETVSVDNSISRDISTYTLSSKL